MKKAIMIALLLGILPLAGCSQKKAEKTNTPTSSTTGVEKSAPAPVSESSSEKTVSKSNSRTWHFTNEQAGYSYDLIISFWEPLPDAKSGASGHPMDLKLLLGSECKFDPSTDLVIPGEIAIKNTTNGFPIDTSVAAIFNNRGGDFLDGGSPTEYTGKGISPGERDGRVSVESIFSNNDIDCESFSSTNNYDQMQPNLISFKTINLGTGQSSAHRFFTIVHNYFSPSLPEGDKELLDWIILRPFVANFKAGGADLQFWDSDTPKEGRSIFSYSPVGLSLSGLVTKPDTKK
jgi:hypothetical protein